MSVKKQIFTKLKEIKTYDTKIKHVGIWHDSMIEPDALEQFNTPALMLEFNPIEWKQYPPQFSKATGRRDSSMIISVHVLYKNNKDANTTFEDAEDLRDSVLKFLPIFKDTQFNQPFLTSETTEHSNNILHDLTLSFIVLCHEPEQTGYIVLEVPPETPTLTIGINGKI